MDFPKSKDELIEEVALAKKEDIQDLIRSFG